MNRLKEKYIDVLCELFNIGVGHGAGVLNRLLSSHIFLSSPEVFIDAKEDFINHHLINNGSTLSVNKMKFSGEFEGYAMLIIPEKDTKALSFQIYKNVIKIVEIENHKKDAMKEVSNIILNSILGTISNITNTHFDYDPPIDIEVEPDSNFFYDPSVPEKKCIILSSVLNIEELDVQSNVILIFNEKSGDGLMSLLQKYLHDRGILMDMA